MQLASKMRYLAAQMDALLTDDLWLTAARHANAMARRLADAVSQVPGVALAYPVESNGVFATMGRHEATALQRDWGFHIWPEEPNGRCTVRFMAAFNTSEEDVDDLAAAVRQAVSRETSPAGRVARSCASLAWLGQSGRPVQEHAISRVWLPKPGYHDLGPVFATTAASSPGHRRCPREHSTAGVPRVAPTCEYHAGQPR